MIEFGNSAERTRNKTVEKVSGETFYDSPVGKRASLNNRFEKLEEGFRQDFERMVTTEAKVDLIRREGSLSEL